MTRTATLRGVLALIALVAAALAGLVALDALTRERAAAEQSRAERARYAALFPPGYDNDPFADAVRVGPEPLLGLVEPSVAWRASRDAEPLGVVLPAVAHDGYAGPITLRIGITHDGRIIGVRVVTHGETPGLGDAIADLSSGWIDAFAHRSLDDPSSDRWTVAPDGDFDAFAGATVSPRAVVHAVRRALEFHDAHRDTLYARDAIPVER